MQNTFTQKMQALRTSMDATNANRKRFLEGLRHNVSDMRSSSQSFLARLHAGHRAAAENMNRGLSAMREHRRELHEDLRRGGAILRAARG